MLGGRIYGDGVGHRNGRAASIALRAICEHLEYLIWSGSDRVIRGLNSFHGLDNMMLDFSEAYLIQRPSKESK